jgi:hypothetical protein
LTAPTDPLSNKKPKRPIGFIILSLAMLWLAITGFFNVWAVFTATHQELSIVLGIIGVIYGIAALVTAIQLWRFQPAAIMALRFWMSVCCVYMLAFAFFVKGIVLGGIFGLLGFLVFIGILFAVLDRYVQHGLRHAVEPA